MKRRKIGIIALALYIPLSVSGLYYMEVNLLNVEFTLFRFCMRLLFAGAFISVLLFFLSKATVKWRNIYEKNRKSPQVFLNRLLIAGVLYVVFGLGFSLFFIPSMLAMLGLFPWDIWIGDMKKPDAEMSFPIIPALLFMLIVTFIWGMIRFAVEERKFRGRKPTPPFPGET